MGLAVAVAIVANARGAERPPAALQHERRSFDFSPPRPGEVLANPASGIGTPPHLVEFSPVGVSGNGEVGSTARRADAAANPAGTPDAAPAPPPPYPTSPPAFAPTEDLTPFQRGLGSRISRVGIEGFLASDGGNPVQAADGGDPMLERTKREIALSLLGWDALYPHASRMIDAPVDADISPGRVTFRHAPDRMVGGAGP